MMKIPIYQVDAFTDRVFWGNPAAVCLLEIWPSRALLQAIARENNLPETAFLVDRGDYYELRWFTPSVEAELCGHATLAAAHVVLQHLHPEWLEVVFRSQRRSLRVSRGQESVLWLSLPALAVTEVKEAEVPTDLFDGLSIPPTAVFAGMDYLAVYDSERAMRALTPRQDILCDLDRRGVIVTSAGSGHDFSSRFFAPKLSIPEDTFTGSTHCALIPFWARRLRKNNLTSRQYSTRFGEPMAIQADCKLSGQEVLIAGATAEYMSGMISLNDEESASPTDWAPDDTSEQSANGGPA
jgi:PhzF family phenazine biosynthesis protein